MRQKVDPVDAKNTNPGPGNYKPDIEVVKPQVLGGAFGSETRKNGKFQETPGPGMYDYSHVNSNNIGTKFSVDNKGSSLVANRNPGPGTYELKSETEKAVLKNKGPKIAEKLKDQDNNKHNPAPSHYNPKLDLARPKQPSFKVGTGGRSHFQNNGNPEPGHYNPEFSQTRMSAPQWGQGSMRRPDINPSKNTPGPGTYDAIKKSDSKF